MEFVGGNHTIFRVSKLPPELMTDDSNIHRSAWLRSILDGEDDASGCKKQHHNDQYGNHRPRQFNLCTSINLSRFGRRVGLAYAKLEQRNRQESANHYKDGPCERNDKQGQIEDLMRRSRSGSKGARNPLRPLRPNYGWQASACRRSAGANYTRDELRQHLGIFPSHFMRIGGRSYSKVRTRTHLSRERIPTA